MKDGKVDCRDIVSKFTFGKLAKKVSSLCTENDCAVGKDKDGNSVWKSVNIDGDAEGRTELWTRKYLKDVYFTLYYSGYQNFKVKDGIADEEERIKNIVRDIDKKIEIMSSDEYPFNLSDDEFEKIDYLTVDDYKRLRADYLKNIEELETGRQLGDFVVTDEFLPGAVYLIQMVYDNGRGSISQIAKSLYKLDDDHTEYGYAVLVAKIKYLNGKVFPDIATEGREDDKIRKCFELVRKYSNEYDKKIRTQQKSGQRIQNDIIRRIQNLMDKLEELPVAFLDKYAGTYEMKNLDKGLMIAEKEIDGMLYNLRKT